MIDIIIPTYKNKQGLRNTLSSINQALLSNFTITIIDDCSNLIYKDIEIQFPFITILQLQQNVGPGIARQYGMQHTKQSYILFMDTGDVFINNQMQQIMITTIKEKPEVYIYSWSHLAEDKNIICKDTHNRLHGRIYSRAFLQKYHITFCTTSSRVNEDVGFNRACRLVLADKEKENNYFHSNQPLVIWRNTDPTSLTRKNNYEFTYNQQNMGLALNEIHVFNISNQNNISSSLLQKQADEIIISMYRNIYYTAQERPEFIQQSWAGAYYFYNEIYKNYEKTPSIYLQSLLAKFIKEISNKKMRKNIPINFRRFIYELKLNDKPTKLYI